MLLQLIWAVPQQCVNISCPSEELSKQIIGYKQTYKVREVAGSIPSGATFFAHVEN